MEAIDLLISTGLNAAQLTPLELRVLFTDDISNVSLENMENIRQQLRESSPKHTKTATFAGDQVHGTTIDLSAPAETVANHTGRRPTTTNNLRQTFDAEDDQEVKEAQDSRRGNSS